MTATLFEGLINGLKFQDLQFIRACWEGNPVRFGGEVLECLQRLIFDIPNDRQRVQMLPNDFQSFSISLQCLSLFSRPSDVSIGFGRIQKSPNCFHVFHDRHETVEIFLKPLGASRFHLELRKAFQKIFNCPRLREAL